MKYERIEKGYFLERPNRFIAEVEIRGKKEIVHVKNTGRCAELLVPEERQSRTEDKVGSDQCEKRESPDQYGFADSK